MGITAHSVTYNFTFTATEEPGLRIVDRATGVAPATRFALQFRNVAFECCFLMPELWIVTGKGDLTLTVVTLRAVNALGVGLWPPITWFACFHCISIVVRFIAPLFASFLHKLWR